MTSQYMFHFSVQDVSVLFVWPNVRYLAVCTLGGNFSEIPRSREVQTSDQNRVRSIYRAEPLRREGSECYQGQNSREWQVLLIFQAIDRAAVGLIERTGQEAKLGGT